MSDAITTTRLTKDYGAARGLFDLDLTVLQPHLDSIAHARPWPSNGRQKLGLLLALQRRDVAR